MEGALKIGIFGGTFSPPHNGHVAAAENFINRVGLTLLYIIPDRIPPHKALVGDDPEVRFELAVRAFSHIPCAVVSDVELMRSGVSYTADTLAYFHRLYREKNVPIELFLLTGTDMFLTLDSWSRPAEIFRDATVVAVRREDERQLDALIAEKARLYRERFGARIMTVECEPTVISSSEIREMLARGEDVSGYLPSAVSEYIDGKGLYRPARDSSRPK